jgi:hypothetical protein
MKEPAKETTKPVEWTIDFEWSMCIDKYRLKSHVEGYQLGEGQRIQEIRKADGAIEAVSDRYQRYKPFNVPALFVRFAKDTPASANGMLQFCNQFGIPEGIPPEAYPRDAIEPRDVTHYVAVDVLLRHQALMRRALNLFEKNDPKALMAAFNAIEGASSARIELRQAEDGHLYWCQVPPDLIRAMWLQFAMHASSGTKLFRCQRCNEPFIVGTHTGRRRTAIYCSNACKVAAFQARHG